MKIDRRSFLALGLGAAAGTALSPIPWKLADDSAIWTQNWPWTPVPDEGEVSYVDVFLEIREEMAVLGDEGVRSFRILYEQHCREQMAVTVQEHPADYAA